MEHLSLDKIIRFISFDEINDENLRLASEVNLHMIECSRCRNKVLSIQNTLEHLLSYSGVKGVDVSNIIIDEDIRSELDNFYGKKD